ncbi:MAG: zf-TFIIB domain-containing protein [Leptospiraceae bacterium]|nr:zf-TFIIB domain-containing protein [Leptospiraceae bacterium]
MQHINYQYSSGIMIDRCNLNHGVWLDKDELEKIQVFVERWEVNSEVDEKYKQVLLSIKAESKENGKRKVSL